MQFYQMAAYTYGVQGQQYGETVAGVSALIGQQQNAVRATFSQGALKEPPRPKPSKELSKEQLN